MAQPKETQAFVLLFTAKLRRGTHGVRRAGEQQKKEKEKEKEKEKKEKGRSHGGRDVPQHTHFPMALEDGRTEPKRCAVAVCACGVALDKHQHQRGTTPWQKNAWMRRDEMDAWQQRNRGGKAKELRICRSISTHSSHNAHDRKGEQERCQPRRVV